MKNYKQALCILCTISLSLIMFGCHSPENEYSGESEQKAVLPDRPPIVYIEELEKRGIRYIEQDEFLMDSRISSFTIDQYEKYFATGHSECDTGLLEFISAMNIRYIKYNSAIGFYTIARCEYLKSSALLLIFGNTNYTYTINIEPKGPVYKSLDVVSQLENGMTYNDVSALLGPGSWGLLFPDDPSYHWIKDANGWHYCTVFYSNWQLIDYYLISL